MRIRCIFRAVGFFQVALILSAGHCLAGDWPMWRYDSARSAASPHSLPDELHLQWVRQLPAARPAWPASQPKLQFDVSYEPVVLGQLMFVGSTVNDSITAYDTRSGKEKWRFYTNGPVRFAPVANNDRLYVCSDDGYLYCLDAATGKNIWKFNGGPAVRPIIGNGRLISTWPARGGVVVADGIAYFAASIWPSMGIFVHAVDADSGRVIWTNSETGSMFITHPHGANSFGSVSPQGSLAVSGKHLIVPGGRTLPAVFDRETGKLQHFNFGGKGGGGFSVMTAGKYFINGKSLMRLADGKLLSSFNAQVSSDGWFFGSAGNSGPIVAQTIDGKVGEKITVDRRGRKVKKLEFTPSEKRQFTPGGPARIFLKAGRRLFATDGKGVIAGYDYESAFESKSKQKPAWTAKIDGLVWSMLAADDRLFVVSRDAKIYCFGQYKIKPNRLAVESRPFEQETNGSAVGKAQSLRKFCNSDAGYAVALGIGESSLIKELLLQTNLHVIAVDANEQRVDRFRREMDAAGLYGIRVTAFVGDPLEFRWPPYLANLVFSEGAVTFGNATAVKVLFKPLRPYGGTACLRMSDEQHAAFVTSFRQAVLQKADVSRHGPWTLLRRVGSLPDAGVWTHQYGDATNSVVSKDKLVKTPLGVLWFGGPSNDRVLPRHGHGPSPQVVGGRVFIEGADMLRSVDVYTGRLWWERNLPGLGKFYENTRHQPGAGEVGSNYVSLEDRVYVIYGSKVLALDAKTGETTKEFTLAQGRGRSKPYWGFIAVHDDFLIATSSPVTVEGATATKSSKLTASFRGFAPLIKPNERWQYLAGSDPRGDWTAVDFKASGWKTGQAGFGYGDNDDRTVLKQMAGKFARVYARKEFDGKSAAGAQALALLINFDDAFIAYLNGKEVARVSVGKSSGAAAVNIASHEAAGYETFMIPNFHALLRPGKNVIAIERHNVGSSSSDFSLDPYLLIKTDAKTTAAKDKPQKAKQPTAKITDLLKASQYSSASRRLTVFNRHTGQLLWSRDARFNFRHNCICIADGKLFCIDGMSPAKLNALRRRGINPDGKMRLLALNVQTGHEVWSTAENVFGTFLNYSVEYDVLLQAGSAYHDRAKDEVGTGIVAYRGRDGNVLWKDMNLKYGGPCLLWHDKIITNGGGGFQLDLRTGKSTGWKYSRMYGCNTAVGSEHLLTFRSGAAGFFDLNTNSGTGNLGGFKSSCTSNLIVADGVLNAPDYTRTCSCAYQNQTSLAMIHMPEAELWTYGAAAIDDAGIDRIGLNFGAPGDRRDEQGTLWLDYPSVGGPSPRVDVKVIADDPIWFRRHSAFVNGQGLNWVAASGGTGIKSVVLKLGTRKTAVTYTVRLHFSEPDDLKPGDRVFSVALQGKAVLQDFDVVKAAGRRNQTLVKEFKSIEVLEKLEVSFSSVRGKPPLLCGIEVVREQQ